MREGGSEGRREGGREGGRDIDQPNTSEEFQSHE